MKKVVIILSVFALTANGCGQKTNTVNNKNISEESNSKIELQSDEKIPFDYKALPAEWAALTYTGEGEKYVIFEDETLTIVANTLIYWNNRYDILKSYQIGDTVVISTKIHTISLGEYEPNFKFFWFDKDKGIGKWTADDENLGNSGLFVIKEKMSEYPMVIPTFAD